MTLPYGQGVSPERKGFRKMKKSTTGLLLLTVLVATVAAFLATPARADSTGTPGQPNQSCQTAFPSGPLSPPGFNTNGFNNVAGSHYAGNGQNTQTPANSNAVSQYDVACFQQAQH